MGAGGGGGGRVGGVSFIAPLIGKCMELVRVRVGLGCFQGHDWLSYV